MDSTLPAKGLEGSQPRQVPGPQLRAAHTIAYVLDGLRLNPVVGLLLPFVGDVVMALAGLSIVGLAWHARLPKPTLARMLGNLAIEAAVGALPLVGDAFDFWFRAHARNAELFARAEATRRSSVGDWLVVALAALGLLLALALPLIVLASIVRWLWSH